MATYTSTILTDPCGLYTEEAYCRAVCEYIIGQHGKNHMPGWDVHRLAKFIKLPDSEIDAFDKSGLANFYPLLFDIKDARRTIIHVRRVEANNKAEKAEESGSSSGSEKNSKAGEGSDSESRCIICFNEFQCCAFVHADGKEHFCVCLDCMNAIDCKEGPQTCPACYESYVGCFQQGSDSNVFQ